MIPSRGDGHGGRGLTYLPKSGSYSRVIYWFHGLGDTADGWADLVPMFGAEDTKFVLPTAPSRPISLNGGHSMPGWSDIYGLHESDPEDKDGFDESAARVNKMIQSEVDKGVSPSKIIVGGFSQGGALAFHISLRSAYSLGGCVALSTWIPLKGDYPAALANTAKNLPIIQMHGTSDQVVAYKWGVGSHELAKTLISSPKPIFVKIEGLGHGWDNDELQPLQSFIATVFSKA